MRFLAARHAAGVSAPRKSRRYGGMSGAAHNLFTDHPDVKAERAADPGSAGADPEAARMAHRFLRSRRGA